MLTINFDGSMLFCFAENNNILQTFMRRGTNMFVPKVAILDTGIDLWHPALRNNIKECRNFTRDGAEADEDGHGTMLAGVIIASKCSGSEQGIAPGVELYIGKVIRNSTG